MLRSDVGACDVGKVRPGLASWRLSVLVPPVVLSAGHSVLCAAVLDSPFTIPWPWPPCLYSTLGLHPVP